ncbi:MAG: GNAT family N-acetyltransferase [Tepidisphaeraceae bacterium]
MLGVPSKRSAQPFVRRCATRPRAVQGWSVMPLLRGQVFSGKGDFGHWIARLREQYRHKTGLELYPGTLNLRLDQAFRVPPGVVRLEPQEYGGTVGVKLVRCRVFGRLGFILRTDRNESGNGHHPLNVIEVATDVKLREVYNLADGDSVEVEVEPFAGELAERVGEVDGVELRVLTERDAGALFAAISRSREHLRPWFDFVDGLNVEADALAFTQRVQRNLRESGRFWAGIWRDGQLCGAIGLTQLDVEHGHAELGIWLAHDCTGRGTASLATRVLLDFLFNRYGIHRVSAKCAVENRSSIALMERLGFTREGTIREAELGPNGHPRDVCVFVIIRPERLRRGEA